MKPDALNGPDSGSKEFPWRLPVLALLGIRLLTLAALPLESLISYGDYGHFYNLAQMAAEGGGGLPFIGHWVEFPPIFPFLSLAIYRLCAGRFHSYASALAILMLLFDLGSLWIFIRLARRHLSESQAKLAVWLYLGFLVVPAFGWWTFEPMAVFWMLLALLAISERKPVWAGVAAGLGFLTKLFPVLSLAVAWAFRPWRRALVATAVALGIVAIVFVPLFVASPEMTGASLGSQIHKGSWETVWALVDGNLRTGLFGSLEERSDPALAHQPRGQPAVVPHWIPSLLAAAAICLAFWRLRRKDDQVIMAFLTFIFCVMLLWSRGWSPQWLAYLFPVLFLTFSMPRAAYLGFGLALVSLMEWPVLLSRNRFDLLWLPVILRTLLLLVIAIEAGRMIFVRRLVQDSGGVR
ncbi:MAG: glycosyltransferase family 87 protein [Anaerolineales bacterium]|jgi:hypothetical protein